MHPDICEAGCDEAGRGCLAGPVFAAAVILKPGKSIEGLNDSKKLSEKERNRLRDIIISNAKCYAVAMVDNHEIDKINILNASILAMHRALDLLKNTPKHILVDGNKFKPYKKIAYTTVVKGDGKYQSIAAASILAKTFRDEFMENIHDEFPQYNWISNKGYPTADHIEALRKYGQTKYHRKSFHLKSDQLRLEF
jgi:ribonuclease HII